MYFNGTVSVKKGSKQLIGVGTKFKYAMANISAGQLITIDSTVGREINIIQSIQSNEELTLFWESKVDISNATYVISTTIAGSLPDYGQKNSATVQWANKLIDGISQLMTSQSDTIKIEMPYGEVVELKTYKSKVSVGDYGIGYVATNNNNPKQNIYKDANDVDFTGFATGNSSSVNFFDYGSPLLSMARFGGSDSTGQIFQMQSRVSKTNNEIAYRTRNVNEWTDWIKLALLDTQKTQEFSGGIRARIVDAVGGNNYVGLRIHSDGTCALYGFRNGSGFDYTLPTYSGEVVLKQGSYIVNYGTTDWTGVKLYKGNKEYIVIEGSSGANTLMQLAYRNTSGNNVAVVDIPKRNGTVALIGDYGLGARGLGEPQNISCFQGVPSASVQGFPTNGAGIQSTYQTNRRAQIFMSTQGIVFTRFSLRDELVDVTTPWNTVYSSKNTTIDSNGFYKRASPIIDINPNGTFVTNDESEGATVTRISQGEYLIEGVLGFNSDAGWGGADGGIEIPLDVNKQPLIWVDAEVKKDGSILVRTYHRTHPNAPKFARNDIDGYKDGDPIDIPDGRFISVRVQMPEGSIYNVRMRALDRVHALESIIRVQEEIMNSKIKLLTKK
ncbi:TPA: hypothetical protein JRS25_004123 [Escherichia coli]|nr:hypothetical protein [Escherichia coli]